MEERLCSLYWGNIIPLLHIFLKLLWFHLRHIPLKLSNHSVQTDASCDNLGKWYTVYFRLADTGQRELEENRTKDGKTVGSHKCHRHHP